MQQAVYKPQTCILTLCASTCQEATSGACPCCLNQRCPCESNTKPGSADCKCPLVKQKLSVSRNATLRGGCS